MIQHISIALLALVFSGCAAAPKTPTRTVYDIRRENEYNSYLQSLKLKERIMANEPIFGYTLHSFVNLSDLLKNERVEVKTRPHTLIVQIPTNEPNFQNLFLTLRPDNCLLEILRVNRFSNYDDALQNFRILSTAFKQKYQFVRHLGGSQIPDVSFSVDISGVQTYSELLSILDPKPNSLGDKIRPERTNYIVHPTLAEAYLMLAKQKPERGGGWNVILGYKGWESRKWEEKISQERDERIKNQARAIDGI